MIHNVIVLGSGPAGYTAALYAARANLKPLMIDGGVGQGQEMQGAGGQLMLTAEVENYPGLEHGIQGPDLMQVMRKQVQRFDVQIVEEMADRVDLSSRPFTITAAGKEYQCKTLIIATGASAMWLGLPEERPAHEGGLGGRGVSACATRDGFFFRGQHVAVVGGGDTAMEEAIYLTNHCATVTVVHRRDSLRASKIMQERALKNPKIKFVWNSKIERINDPAAGEVTSLTLRNVVTGEQSELPVTGLFVAIGHRPNTSLFRGVLQTDESGYLVTHNDVRTNVVGVFACGDVQDTEYRQAITAAGSGCMAAIQAERLLEAENSGIESTSETW